MNQNHLAAKLRRVLYGTTAISTGTVDFKDGDPMIQFLREFHEKYPTKSYPEAGAAYMMFMADEQMAREAIAWAPPAQPIE
jgi:hypothetical protein